MFAGWAIAIDATEIPLRDQSAIPRQITIPSLGVDAPVDIVGLIGDGKVEVPTDVLRTGWYQYSQVAGASTGSTVVVGHKDGVRQGAVRSTTSVSCNSAIASS